jgi:ABC-2 type transport system ATP-binding protein
MPAVSFQHVSKLYPALKALDDVSFDIERGEFFALLGPNGAGKTTLISILAGLTRATGGRVQVLGHDVVNDFVKARKALGVVPQELVFDPFFTVREALRIQSGYFGLTNNDAWIAELLEHLGLSDKANTNMRMLSGGMKRRVLIAQALVHKPPVIVLDEPTAGVDVELRQTLWHFITRLNREGSTVLLTTHYLEEAEALCSRVAMLKGGKLVSLARTADLLQKFSAQLLEFRVASGALPEGLRDVAKQVGQAWRVPAPDAAAIESVLAAARAHGAKLEDIAIRKADLEDVFLSLVGTAGESS